MRFKTGVVVSTKMAKTVTVLVDRLKAHPKYKKQYKVSDKFYAHNESTEIKVGDKVTIIETRPLSKLKRWRVISEKEQAILVAANLKSREEKQKQTVKYVPQKKEFLFEYKKRTKKVAAEAPAPTPKETPAAAPDAEATPAS